MLEWVEIIEKKMLKSDWKDRIESRTERLKVIESMSK